MVPSMQESCPVCIQGQIAKQKIQEKAKKNKTTRKELFTYQKTSTLFYVLNMKLS